MNREIVISACNECPYFSNEYYSYDEKCLLLKRVIEICVKENGVKVFQIPEDCPLPKTDKPATEF